MRDVWLKSIRDAILAVFFLGTAALGFWAVTFPGNPELQLVGYYGGIGCLLLAAFLAGRSLLLPWEVQGRTEWERQKADAAWNTAASDPPSSKPKNESPAESAPRSVP